MPSAKYRDRWKVYQARDIAKRREDRLKARAFDELPETKRVASEQAGCACGAAATNFVDGLHDLELAVNKAERSTDAVAIDLQTKLIVGQAARELTQNMRFYERACMPYKEERERRDIEQHVQEVFSAVATLGETPKAEVVTAIRSLRKAVSSDLTDCALKERGR